MGAKQRTWGREGWGKEKFCLPTNLLLFFENFYFSQMANTWVTANKIVINDRSTQEGGDVSRVNIGPVYDVTHRKTIETPPPS